MKKLVSQRYYCPKYYLESRHHCEDCDGAGYSHFSKTVHVRRRCPKCDGYGFIKDQIEVKLASVGEGTFVISGIWRGKLTE